MSYPWVPAPDNWPRTAPIRAIVVHMAEGGGTVQWLKRNDGNSSHYVVEYTGRIVQMVREDRAAGSIDPTKVRTTDDAAFEYLGESVRYGATAAKAALGSYWSNPNQAVIAIETEGFAKTGPNGAQRGSLKALIRDIRTRHNVPVLGHRDFQSYKACPGKLIPWADYGGHGVQQEEVVQTTYEFEDAARAGWLTVKADVPHFYIRLRDGEIRGPINPTTFGRKRAFGPVKLVPPIPGGEAGADRATAYVVGTEAAGLLIADVEFTADALPVTDCTNAIAAELERAAERAAVAVRGG